MTQEEKQLLLKDLCARLPYRVKINLNNGNEIWTLNGIFEGEHTGMMLILEQQFSSKNITPKTSNWSLSLCKPYFRPMSSMTEEEKVQLSQYACIGEDLNGEFIDEVQRKDCAAYIDWLNKNHFDYRGLIEKGLAIEVTKENNPYKG